MKEETVWITNRFGEKLEAFLRMPDDQGKNPTVLLVGGFGSNLHEDKGSFDEIAGKLASVGFVTLQFSFAGKGNSEGSYEQMSLSRAGAQIDDVLSWLNGQPSVDSDRIGIIAISFGVPSTLSATHKIKSYLFIGGVYYPLRMKPLFVESGGYIPTGISFRNHSDGTISRVGPQFWKDIQAFDAEHTYKSLNMSVCMLHGDNDVKIPVDDVQKAFSLIPNNKKRKKIYPGGNHGMVGVPRHQRVEFLQDIVNWFKETL